jgi:cytochrome P450
VTVSGAFISTHLASRPSGSRAALARGSPPGPRGLPWLGNLPEFARDALGFLTRCSREYGDVVNFRLGTWPGVLINSPELIEQVLVKEHRNFIKHRFFWRQVTAIFGHGLLTAEGEFWQRQRRLAAPAFTGQRLANYGAVMVRHTERMLDGWRAGEVRNIHADMMALTLGIAAKTLFDAEVERDVAEIGEAVEAVVAEIAARYARPFVIPDLVPLPGHIRYRRGLRTIETVVQRIVQERRNRPQDDGDLLSMLMQARDESGNPMSGQQLRDEAVTLLLAGHETTALALSWTWYLLAKHPEIQAGLAAEVAKVVGTGNATAEDLPRLRFTEKVVTEAMRLYPPAWAMGREAVNDCEIGGYPVPAGTTVSMSQWVLHRDPRYFENPEAFRPERWSDEFTRQLPRFAYFPFGGGPRICIGNRFAIMEAVLVIATIVQRFRLEARDNRPVIPFPSITLRPAGGVWVRTQVQV